MADNTPRLGLNTYGQGEDGWSHNDTAKALDELAIERGPIADRPASGDYDDELYHATDQGITWRWDSGTSDWTYFSGKGSSSQPVPGTSHFNAVSAGDTTTGKLNRRVVNANAQTGADIAEKVTNALSKLEGGSGCITINPPSGGGALTWGSDITINPNNYAGVDIDAGQTRIEYPGTGTPITWDSGGLLEANFDGETLGLYGGRWFSTGTDPNGFLLLKDIGQSTIKPRIVKDFQNTNGDAYGVRMENHGKWCEANHIGGSYLKVDIAVDSAPASVTGGSGTGSFQDTYVEHLHTGTSNIGMRLRGEWRDCTVLNPTVILRQDNTTGYLIDGPMDGCVFYSPEVEDPSDNSTGNVGWKTGTNYAERLLVIGGHPATSVETHVDDANGTILAVRRSGPTLDIGSLRKSATKFSIHGGGGHIADMGTFSTGSAFTINNGFRSDEKDLSTHTPSKSHVVHMHSGADGNPAGYYRWDNANSQWVKIEDNTVTISPA